MNFALKLVIIAILTLVLGPYFHFWAAAIVSLLINNMIRTGGWSTFFSGFLGVGLTWYFYSLYLYGNGSEGIADMVAEIFGLSSSLLFITSAFLGGLVAGLGATTARSFYRLFEKKKYNPYS